MVPLTWENTIKLLRTIPEHQKLIFDSYLTEDLIGNCTRFAQSSEFVEILKIVNKYAKSNARILDIAAGNGISSYAFAKAGYRVDALDPDPSDTVGTEAIRLVKEKAALESLNISNGTGEKIPFKDQEFDVIHIRQGLHHARNLNLMVAEMRRVLRSGGIALAVREHVIDNHGESLERFLDAQVDHQYYGGENAFTLKEYRDAFNNANFEIINEFGPFDSDINLFPDSLASLKQRALSSKPGRLLKTFLSENQVFMIARRYLSLKNEPGRLYSFVVRKK